MATMRKGRKGNKGIRSGRPERRDKAACGEALTKREVGPRWELRVGGPEETGGTAPAGQARTLDQETQEPRYRTGRDAQHINAVREHRTAANTRNNYTAQWRKFQAWALNRQVQPMPAASGDVAAYLAERSEVHGHKPATLRAAAAAIGFFHREAGLDDPCDSKEVREILSGATRKTGSYQKQAEGLTDSAFRQILESACIPRTGRGRNRENETAARTRGEKDIAIISLMRDAMLRVSEAAALTWSDLDVQEDGTGRLLIRRSKTDVDGESAVAFVSAPTMEYLERIRGNAPEEDSVFFLQRNQLARRIKRAAQEAGLGDGFSGHSPRVGMARDLARSGIELPRLMTAGRWRSPRMPALYIRNETVSRGAVAQYYGASTGPGIGRAANDPGSPSRMHSGDPGESKGRTGVPPALDRRDMDAKMLDVHPEAKGQTGLPIMAIVRPLLLGPEALSVHLQGSPLLLSSFPSGRRIAALPLVPYSLEYW